MSIEAGSRARHLLPLLWVAFSASAFAWGPNGHQTVGRLADELIAGTPAASHVRELIGISLQQASVWADCAKGVTPNAEGRLAYRGDPARYPECDPFTSPEGQARMVDFVSRNLKSCNPQPGQEDCHKQYHYTDVALQRDHYARGYVGTSDHDIVAATAAAIAVLRGQPSPPPLHIKDPSEALLLLAHYLGDLHQPLHVQSVYLDARGQVVDPDQGAYDPATQTVGGNAIVDATHNLHSEWDGVPDALKPDRLGSTGVAEARRVPPTPGEVSTWPEQWATDTFRAAGPAFAGVSYAPEDEHRHWSATVPEGYAATRAGLQRAQLLKGGARLAQLLQAIWP